MTAKKVTEPPALEIDQVSIEFYTVGGYVRAVNCASFEVQRGEIVAIVGESGSGKSILLQSILGVARGRPGVVAGNVTVRQRSGAVVRPFEGISRFIQRDRDSNGLTRSFKVNRRWWGELERRTKQIRGHIVGLALQNGRSALDPMWRVGHQIETAVAAKHPELDRAGRRDRCDQWLTRLGFPDPRRVAGSYPHELSGGMAQRAMLAVVLAREPEMLFLDEITTGLDVSLQAAVLKLVQELHAELQFTAVMVTHELGIARSLSTRTIVMRKGEVVEKGLTRELFGGGARMNTYTAKLFGSEERPEAMDTIDVPQRAPRVEAVEVGKAFRAKRALFTRREGDGQTIKALSPLSISIAKGECLALVGESGSGKTTLSRILVGLLRPDEGTVVHNGQVIADLRGEELVAFRRGRTILFQNPYTSLNPAMTAEEVIAEALQLYKGVDASYARLQAWRVLDMMGLRALADRKLRALSGGERRRIGLLRAIQSTADLIVLDEPTAGLDAVHRVRVAEVIRACRAEHQERSMVIVSHDLGFVTSVVDKVAVLYRGEIVETCPVNSLLRSGNKHHPYTESLWAAARFVGGHVNTNGAEANAPEQRAPALQREAPARSVGFEAKAEGGSHVSG